MKVPGYTIVRELGRGGMATVYLAIQERLNRQVALKVMEPISDAIEDFTQRFAKEGQIIAQFQHPQIITIYDFDSYDGAHYFSMEYLPGGTLAERIPQGLPLERILEIVTKVAEALAYAHERGIIHRDLKPQNILFRRDGTPVLSDFGIAKVISASPETTQLTQLGTAIGSPRYMSPEQITSQTLDPRSDLYSLGLVFFEMLTGQQPYRADDVITLAMKHCSEPAPPLPRELSGLQPILDKLLAKRPDERFDSAKAVVRALERIDTRTLNRPSDDDETRIVAPAQAPSRAGPAEPPAPKPPRRARKGLTILAATLLVTAAAAGTYFVFFHQPAPKGTDVALGLPPAPSDRSPTASEYERLALEHFRRNEFQQSLELTKLGLASAPGDTRLLALQDRIAAYRTAAALRKEAAQRAQDGRYEQSLQLIDQGLQQVPGHAGLKGLRAEVERRIRQRKAREAQQLLAKAKGLQQQGDLDGAMKLVEQGLGLVPSDPALKSARTGIQTQIANRKKAEALLAEARKRQQEGALDESLTLIAQGLRLAPDNAELLALRQTVQDRQETQRRAKAEKLLAQAKQEQDQGALPKALGLINQALKEVPNDPDLLARRDQLQSQLDTKNRIEGLLRACSKEFPLDRLSAEKAGAAAACYQKVIAASTNNPEARAKLGRIADLYADWVTTALSGGELDRAATLLSGLTRLRPDYPALGKLKLELKAKSEAAAAQAQRIAEEEARKKAQRRLAPEMAPIKGGCFEMGSPPSEPGREADERQHKVCVKDFQIGKYEVKVKEFRRFVQATGYQTLAERDLGPHADNGCWALDQSDTDNPWKYRSWANWKKPNKYRPTDDEHPVSCISWLDAEAYIAWLNQETGGHYRLPTEAEWEYAARAGATTARFWGDGVDARACKYADVADAGHQWADSFPCDDAYEWAAPVGQYRPNAWGLYDMLGNLFEWTCSPYDQAYDGAETKCMGKSPAVPVSLRGGSWYSGPKPVRSAYRDRNYADARYDFLGFRLAGD